jgi:flagellar hook-length control protein FliK
MTPSVSVTTSTAAAQPTGAAANAAATAGTAPSSDIGAMFVQLVLQLLAGSTATQPAEEKSAPGGKTLPPKLPSTEAAAKDLPAVLAALIPGTIVNAAAPAADAPTEASGDAPAIGNASASAVLSAAQALADLLTKQLALKSTDAAAGKGTATVGDVSKTGDAKADAMAKVIAGAVPDKLVDKLTADPTATDARAAPNAGTGGATQPDSSTVAAALPATAGIAASGGAKAAGNIADGIPVAVQRDFENALGDRVVWLTNTNVHSAEIQVTPPDLGPIQVHIQVNNDQASIAFGATQPQVRAAIEAAIPRLREMLGMQGLNLTDVNVSQHSFTDRRGEGGFAGGGNASDGDVAITSATTVSRRVALGMVDYYA